MEKSKICLTVFYLLCISLSCQQDATQSNKNASVRHKKKVVAVKKPLRSHQDRPSRQSGYAHSNQPIDDYQATSEPSSINWKPITYSVFSEGPDEAKPTEVSAIVNGNVGHISRTVQRPQPAHDDGLVGDQFQDYTLLQYYIPFEQIISHSKPINEPSTETPKEPISFERLNKAAVEPVAVFKKENEAETHSENDNEFTGRYEYEYFVQDDHWGTNFGHKEYRDGKHTKGDYEVVLPDGRVQHVKYWSDATGYHASVTYHPLYQKYKHV